MWLLMSGGDFMHSNYNIISPVEKQYSGFDLETCFTSHHWDVTGMAQGGSITLILWKRNMES